MEFELTPASSGTVLVLWLISALLVATALMFVWVSWSASHGSITITDQAIQVSIPLYGRTIPISNLNLAGAQVLDLDATSEIRAVTRSNGIGLPGYAVGWFKLSSGRKALMAVTRGRVLSSPTTEGYSLLLSVSHPDVALKELRSAGGA